MKPAKRLLVLLLLGGGCASTKVYDEPEHFQAYDGSPRPAHEVATLLVAPPLQVRLVDARAVPSHSRTYSGDSWRIELLPGSHRVRCYYWSRTRSGNVITTERSQDDATVDFVAGPGRFYRLTTQYVGLDTLGTRRVEFKVVPEFGAPARR